MELEEEAKFHDRRHHERFNHVHEIEEHVHEAEEKAVHDLNVLACPCTAANGAVPCVALGPVRKERRPVSSRSSQHHRLLHKWYCVCLYRMFAPCL